jgi:hypothetical protein
MADAAEIAAVEQRASEAEQRATATEMAMQQMQREYGEVIANMQRGTVDP